MKIGILTFYRVINFGANLQALSTYRYLEKHGYTPILINYQSAEMLSSVDRRLQTDKQARAHLGFVDKYMHNQTKMCVTSEEVSKVMEEEGINRVIVGSDAVIQHHPLMSRIHVGRRKPFYIEKVIPERMFPNLAWGAGFPNNVKLAMMSASSQNSRFDMFFHSLKMQMKSSLERFSYLSVRDSWTQQMLSAIMNKDYPITPDPVFAFNQNAGDFVPSKEEILKKYNLPEKYVLVSLMRQSISETRLSELYALLQDQGQHCVSLPMPTGHGFKDNFDYHIPEPLDPLDWYALIKYASAYIGSNMHPIIVCLHNAVPCFSIDNWGTKNFFNRPQNNGSSKIEHILASFGLENYHKFIENQQCDINPSEIVNLINVFPKQHVSEVAQNKFNEYLGMMEKILLSLK